MAAPIAPIAPVLLPTAISPLAGASPAATAAASSAGSFQQLLQSAMQHVQNSSATAETAVQNYLSGNGTELHSTILATQNADLDMEMFLQVRNKVVSAYEEIMKMQI
jgi:flagellar hook-basal body complex protein FliE